MSRCKYKYFNVNGKAIRGHKLVAEKALGRPLRGTERVHHVDYDKGNNDPSNLVICPDDAYHFLLHRRTDSLNATGSPDNLKCQYCGEWGNDLVTAGSKGYHRYHSKCKNEYVSQYKKRRV